MQVKPLTAARFRAGMYSVSFMKNADRHDGNILPFPVCIVQAAPWVLLASKVHIIS